MKVRIALATNSAGEWNAVGWGNLLSEGVSDERMDKELLSAVEEGLGEPGEAHYFIEADLPPPVKPPTVVGTIVPVGQAQKAP